MLTFLLSLADIYEEATINSSARCWPEVSVSTLYVRNGDQRLFADCPPLAVLHARQGGAPLLIHHCAAHSATASDRPAYGSAVRKQHAGTQGFFDSAPFLNARFRGRSITLRRRREHEQMQFPAAVPLCPAPNHLTPA